MIGSLRPVNHDGQNKIIRATQSLSKSNHKDNIDDNDDDVDDDSKIHM